MQYGQLEITDAEFQYIPVPRDVSSPLAVSYSDRDDTTTKIIEIYKMTERADKGWKLPTTGLIIPLFQVTV